MSEAISLFVDRLQSGGEVNADTGLVFYAGHGVQIDGENYLLPTNVSARNVVSLIDSALPLNNLIRQLEKTKKAGLIFLDCCRNNPFPAATRALGGGLAKIDAPAGTFIAFSTAPGAVALDGEDTSNSPFTTSLVTHLLRGRHQHLADDDQGAPGRVREVQRAADAVGQLVSARRLRFRFDHDHTVCCVKRQCRRRRRARSGVRKRCGRRPRPGS